jgi:hypothetical protein
MENSFKSKGIVNRLGVCVYEPPKDFRLSRSLAKDILRLRDQDFTYGHFFLSRNRFDAATIDSSSPRQVGQGDT